jgi:hypothetical protein
LAQRWGGLARLLLNYAPFLASRRCFERQSRCPLEPVLGIFQQLTQIMYFLQNLLAQNNGLHLEIDSAKNQAALLEFPKSFRNPGFLSSLNYGMLPAIQTPITDLFLRKSWQTFRVVSIDESHIQENPMEHTLLHTFLFSTELDIIREVINPLRPLHRLNAP